MSRVARRSVAIAAGLTCLGAGAWLGWRQFARPTVDQRALRILEGLTLPDAQGNPYPLATLTGKTVVLNFWATWCPPCVEEMPELAALHNEIVPRNGTVIGIGIDSPANIREFASKQRFPYPLLVGGMGGSELSRLLGNPSGALPFTVVISPRGHIAEQILGRIKLPLLRKQVLAQLA